MQLRPISISVLDQTEEKNPYDRAKNLLVTIESASPYTLLNESHMDDRTRLAEHIALYLTVFSTALLMELTRLDPKRSGLKADGVTICGSIAAWRRFLRSPQAMASINIQMYLLPAFIRKMPGYFSPDEMTRKCAENTTEAQRNVMDQLFSLDYTIKTWEDRSGPNTVSRLNCVHHTLLVIADAFTLFPLARLLESGGIATLMPTDIQGAMPFDCDDTSHSPQMPNLSEQWFNCSPDTTAFKTLEEAEVWYNDLRWNEGAAASLACMPAIMQTRLLATATESQWMETIHPSFTPWENDCRHLTPFYRHVLKKCGFALYEPSGGRIGYSDE